MWNGRKAHDSGASFAVGVHPAFPVDFTSSPLSAPCEQAVEIHGRVRHGCGNRDIVNLACSQRGENPVSALFSSLDPARNASRTPRTAIAGYGFEH